MFAYVPAVTRGLHCPAMTETDQYGQPVASCELIAPCWNRCLLWSHLEGLQDLKRSLWLTITRYCNYGHSVMLLVTALLHSRNRNAIWAGNFSDFSTFSWWSKLHMLGREYAETCRIYNVGTIRGCCRVMLVEHGLITPTLLVFFPFFFFFEKCAGITSTKLNSDINI